MNLLKTENKFQHEVFGDLTTIKNENNEVFFIGKEVATLLGYVKPTNALAEHVKEKHKIELSTEIGLSLGVELGQRGGVLITEAGLYSLVMRSKLEKAIDFQDWVTIEVLPSIRKTGSYSILNEEQMLKSLFPSSDINLINLTAQSIRESKIKEKLLLEQAPKVDFYDTIIEADGSFDLQEVSALMKLSYGRNTLFKRLREGGVLIKSLPYREFIDAGYFIVNESSFEAKSKVIVSYQTRVTQKGLDWLLKNKVKFGL
jgi:anti-repressor protein